MKELGKVVPHHATYHNGVNGAYPGAGQHSVDELWDHGKVDGHPVALFHTSIQDGNKNVAFRASSVATLDMSQTLYCAIDLQ